MSEDVRVAVAEAWRNARENGHDFENKSSEEIADDMMECDADIEKMSRRDVLAAVKLIRSES